jgi:CheY-like chemotaxis protein
MTTILPALPLSPTIDGTIKKKRVLLVDTSAHTRELRAETMRKLGIDVDCAADISEARSWWRADLYNLVLLNVHNDELQRNEFCGDIRRATPQQQMAFLVGKPAYLADSPQSHEDKSNGHSPASDQIGDIRSALSADIGTISRPWGILEASRRISAVRSACIARLRAMRDRPAPPRDSEARPSRRTPNSTNLSDLLREEMR